MKYLGQRTPEGSGNDIANGEFNKCEHTLLELEPGMSQTISVKLPNGKHVTFCFSPSNGNEFECVDIHSTVGPSFVNRNTVGGTHWVHHLIGFSPAAGDTFDTRDVDRPTSLVTLLLEKAHYEK